MRNSTKAKRESVQATAAAEAFAKRKAGGIGLTFSTGDAFWFQGQEYVRRWLTLGGKPQISFNFQGWATQITVNRMNAVAKAVFGEALFRRKNGKIYFGPGFLREVGLRESLSLPEDWSPTRGADPLPHGVTHERSQTIRSRDPNDHESAR